QELMKSLNSAIRRKTAIDRNDNSCDEAGRIAGKPDGSSDQIVWQSEPTHRSVIDNGLPTVGKRLVFINEERPVLIPEKKAGGNGIYSKAFTELPCELNGQPSRQILYRCLCHTVTNDSGKGFLSAHRRNVNNRSTLLFSHYLTKNL